MFDLGMDLKCIQRIAFRQETSVRGDNFLSGDTLRFDKAIQVLQDDKIPVVIEWLFLLSTSKASEIDQLLQFLSVAVRHRRIEAIVIFDPDLRVENALDKDFLGTHWSVLRDVLDNRTCGGFLQDCRAFLV
jgi:hypothetical protein